ncbi:MAG: hypothetical protein AAB383_04775 [Patescibacteria group bacterium]
MKILLALSLLAALVSGCERETSMTEDTDLMDIYETDVDTEETSEVEEVETEDGLDPEEVPVTSVGPSEIPADLIPSR